MHPTFTSKRVAPQDEESIAPYGFDVQFMDRDYNKIIGASLPDRDLFDDAEKFCRKLGVVASDEDAKQTPVYCRVEVNTSRWTENEFAACRTALFVKFPGEIKVLLR